MYEDLIKALRTLPSDYWFTRHACQDAADAIEALQAHCNQARLDCAIAERNHVNTLARLLDAQERITELTAERDALLKSFTVTSQPIKVIQPKGVVE